MDPTNDKGGGSDVLSQSDVEKLLAQVAEEQSTIDVHKGTAVAKLKQDQIQPYDFRHPVFLSPTELRKLRLRHEEFIIALAARLSLYLRLEFALQMSKLQTITYQQFTEGLQNPTHLTLFKLDPLWGVSILDIHPRLGLTMVDRLMGGPGHSINAEHDLREIERALLDEAVMIILHEWCANWSKVQELRPSILGHENNGRFLQTAPHDTIMLVLTMEARLGDCLDQMQIAFPYYTLEPLIRKLSESDDSQMKEPLDTKAAAPAWNRRLDEVQVPIVAEWQGLEMMARELANLKVGDVLQLDPQCVNQIKVRLSESTKFQARLGTQGGRWAVELINVFGR